MSESVDQSVPVGFSDVSIAREIFRRLKMRAALKDARVSIEELLELLDKSIQADRDRSASLFDEAGNLLPAEVERLQRDAAINAVARKDMREQELLDGVKLVLELLDRVGVGIRHGLFSSCGGDELMCADGYSHRLCEVRK